MRVMGTGSCSMVVDPAAKEIYSVLEYKILLMKEENPDLILVTGMAEGWDEAIAKVGFRNDIPYEAYLPNSTYGAYYWGRKSQTGRNRTNVFQELLNAAADVHVVCNGLYVDGVHSNFIRNSAMIDVADYALVYDKGSSGTRDAVAKLAAKKVPYELYPFAQGKLFT